MILVTLYTLWLWLAASVGLTVGSVLVIDAVVFFWRKP
jgi:hypothetical protein